MSAWDFTVEPAPLRGLAAGVTAAYLGVAALPWCVGCGPGLAAALSGLTLAGLGPALRALPGRYARVRQLRFLAGAWTGRPPDGPEAAAGIGAGTRVLPGVAFCRLRVGARRADLWVFRDMLPAPEFRRLKVALRCSRPAAAP